MKSLQLGLVFFVIKVLWALDEFGAFSKAIFSHIFRFSLYSIVLLVIFTGFPLNSEKTRLYDFPRVFVPEVEAPVVLGTSVNNFPKKVNQIPFPDVSAQSVFAIDLSSKHILVDVNKNLRLAPASTSKLMTALVALDIYQLDEVLRVPEFCTQIDGQKAGFLTEDRYKVRDLISSLVVNSSADSACSLAVGKLSYNDFVDKMNEKAHSLDLQDTSYTNPVGLDGENGSHYSTANDLYKLASAARSNAFIKNLVSMKEIKLQSENGVLSTLYNTNQLLWSQPGTVGIKTGKTAEAGEVLIYEYEMDEKNLIIIVMRSQDRFEDTLNILNWILNSYSWQN